MFEASPPTPGATAVTAELPPLVPVPSSAQAQSKVGSAIGLNAFRALGKSVAGAAIAIVILGVSSF